MSGARVRHASPYLPVLAQRASDCRKLIRYDARDSVISDANRDIERD
jgi:hypothetical protein